MSCIAWNFAKKIPQSSQAFQRTFSSRLIAHSRFSIMFRAVVTFASFTVVSANCAENPSSPECAARGQDLLQKHASFGAGGAGLQLEATPLMLGSTVTKNLPTFFLFFLLLGENTGKIWSSGKSELRKLAKFSKFNTRAFFFFEFWICLPKNESFHVFLLTSGWALLPYSRRPRSPMHMQGSSARAVGFRSNEQIWFLTIGPKERKPSAVMLRALRMPPGEEVFHFSVSFQEFWTSVGKNFHKVLSRKAWKDCKTLFILAFLRFFFPSMVGP